MISINLTMTTNKLINKIIKNNLHLHLHELLD